MRNRISPLTGAALALALLLGCTDGGPLAVAGVGGADAELARRAQAMQRTVLEGAATGALLGGAGAALFGGEREDIVRGAVVGAAAGAAAGTYVAYLQQQYATDEDRLERLRADIERTNAETEAAVRNMRQVLTEDRRRLAAARATGTPEEVEAAEAAAERNVANMRLVTDGAERRRSEFLSTRSLQLAGGQTTGVDAEINELSRNIAEMRAITDLAEEF